MVSRVLALSRRKDEAIVINDNIEIKVIDIKGDQVKLGISAPKSVPIYRKEVYLQIQDSNKESVASIDVNSLKNLLKN
jgi:carbon storage regulator